MAIITKSQQKSPAPAIASGRVSPIAIIGKILLYAVLVAWAVAVIFPMGWAVLSSLKSDQEIFFSPWSMPQQLLFENFARAWTKAQLGAYVGNTLLVMVPALFFTLLLSAMVAYVLARFEFFGRDVIFYTFLIGMTFPIFLGLVPLYFVMQSLRMLNSFFGLILVYIAYSLPFTVFFLTSFFRTLPKELAEAATIDGANQYQIFFKVMLPLAQPGLVTVGIFNFLGMWNQYILPNALMNNAGLDDGQTRYVLSQGLYYLQNQQQYSNDWSGLFAAVTIVMIPTLVVYIIFNEQIQKGLTAGAIKG